ncbi:MAG: 5'-nucleotidase C-terminal domain-containing protein [Saprospiraceae bacterium]
MDSFKKWCLFLYIGVFSSIHWASGQNIVSNDNTSGDSVFTIQFIALSDSTNSFEPLRTLGKVIREFIPERGIYRYSLGYFDNRLHANSVLIALRSAGFKDAFVRKNIVVPSLPVEFMSTDSIISKEPEKIPEAEISDTIKFMGDQPITVHDSMSAQSEKENVRINFLYTGKSFGVLGNTRFQSEHEMTTEYAVEKDIKFKLVSHACWRAKGLTVFLPSDEPNGDELDLILNERSHWEVLESIEALVTHNVLMFQDPDRTGHDMLRIILNNPKLAVNFPEIKQVKIKLYRAHIHDKIECLIVEEADAEWPSDEAYWSIGEVNRVDFGKKGRLFELPNNQGGFGHRSTILNQLTSSLSESGGHVVKIDMGHRNADYDVSNIERSRLDITGLDSLGYSILLPFEFEFLIGVDSLNTILKEHPSLSLLASNVSSSVNPGLFTSHKILEIGGVRIGLLALADPSLESNLPGKILINLKFEDIISAAQKAVDKLQESKPDVIMALSNMKTSDNARLSENVKGINLVVSNFTDHAMSWTSSKEIKINQEERQSIGAPYDISSIRDFGIEIGRIEMNFNVQDSIRGADLQSIIEQSYKVTDRTASDNALMAHLTKGITVHSEERGDLLFPAFIDLIEQNPDLENFDETTRNGRVSKPMWEKFISRILTNGAPSEVSIIRKIPTFLPLIGKLHEREVRSWLWFEDEIVLMDMKGRDIKRLLEADRDETLVTSGIVAFKSPGGAFYTIMGRPVQDDVYYRVATTNVISNGVLKEYFRWGLRHASKFEIQKTGILKDSKDGAVLPLRDYVLSELRRIRSYGKGKEHHRRIADLLVPKLPYQKLFSFNFARPTLWTSLNRAYKGNGYEAIPESRVISGNSFVIGAEGGIIATLDKEKSEWGIGMKFAFAQQSVDIGNGIYQKTENADDINLNITYKYRGSKREAFHPYTRLEYDSEFTPTVNRNTGLENAKQKILRNVIGISKGSTSKWPVLELGLTAENDFSNNNYQYGLQGRSLGRFPLDKNWNVIYSLTNNFNYYLPNRNDSERDLSIKYNMVHEVLIPLFGDISLSVAADLFFFKGKTEFNRDPGMSMLMKVGLSYNRLWKPRFQSLF